MTTERGRPGTTSPAEADALLQLACRAGLAVAFVDGGTQLGVLSPVLQQLLNLPAPVVPVDVLVAHLDLSTDSGPDRLQPHERPIMRAVRGELVEDAAVSLRPPGQPVRHLRVDAVPLRGAGGEPRGAWALVTDVTARVAAARGELDRSLSETVDHDLRTPLTTVLGHAELLLEQKDDLPPAAAQSVEAVWRASRRLAEVVTLVSDWIDAACSLSGAARATDLARRLTRARRRDG